MACSDGNRHYLKCFQWPTLHPTGLLGIDIGASYHKNTSRPKFHSDNTHAHIENSIHSCMTTMCKCGHSCFISFFVGRVPGLLVWAQGECSENTRWRPVSLPGCPVKKSTEVFWNQVRKFYKRPMPASFLAKSKFGSKNKVMTTFASKSGNVDCTANIDNFFAAVFG